MRFFRIKICVIFQIQGQYEHPFPCNADDPNVCWNEVWWCKYEHKDSADPWHQTHSVPHFMWDLINNFPKHWFFYTYTCTYNWKGKRVHVFDVLLRSKTKLDTQFWLGSITSGWICNSIDTIKFPSFTKPATNLKCLFGQSRCKLKWKQKPLTNCNSLLVRLTISQKQPGL